MINELHGVYVKRDSELLGRVWLKSPMTSRFHERIQMVLLALSLIIAILVFLKNAWVTEDAYILFRSIEQLFAGNGPIWNPHERVQVFTSPFWFWLLSLIRIFSSDAYLNAITASFILWLSTIFILRRLFNNNAILLASILLFTASTGFFDYTSSGLENPLAYFIICSYILYYFKLFPSNAVNSAIGSESEKRIVRFTLFLFGLIIFVRHDLTLLLLPSIIYVMWTKSQVFTEMHWVIIIIASLLPLALWSLFSLFYYGFPFPNTAYAKLNTGIDKIDIFKQGAKYFISSLRFDTITLVVIVSSLILSFINATSKHLNYLGYGVIFNLLYIGYVGGDFMQGRFFSYAYMVSVILLLSKFDTKLFYEAKPLVWLAMGLYIFLYPHTPFNSRFHYQNKDIYDGVADERGYYFNKVSLYHYFTAPKKLGVFPISGLSFDGIEFKNHSDLVRIYSSIGIYGYWSGINKIIIDPLGIADPLLARMPVRGPWRIGHFQRDVPDGYVESIVKGNEVIVDTQINEFYKRLKIITQSDELFAMERLKAIILINVGAYNHFLQDM